MDKRTDPDPIAGIVRTTGDEAFLRMAEDSYEAAGRPKDTVAADRVWLKLASTLEQGTQQVSRNVRPITSARKRSLWTMMGGSLAVAAAIFFVLWPSAKDQLIQDEGGMQTRSGAGDFKCTLKLYEQSSDGTFRELDELAGEIPRHIYVKITANLDSQVALFRQKEGAAPQEILSLAYLAKTGDMQVLDEDATSGTRYCVVGAVEKDGLKRLIELIPQVWSQLPESSCRSVP